MRRISLIATVVFLLALTGVPLVSCALPDVEFSLMENRYLARFPKATLQSVVDGSFESGFEEYVADRLPGRDGWIALKSAMERALGKTENNGVYTASGALIERFSSYDEARLEANIAAVKRFAESSGARTYLMLAPTAAWVERGKLPYGAPNADQRALLERVTAEIPGVESVDVISALEAHADEYIYYRTDHHWTTLGAYYGYRALAEALGFEATPISAYDVETAEDEFYGTLYSKSGVRGIAPDEIEFFVAESASFAYAREFLAAKDKYKAFLGGNQPIVVLEGEGEGKLLVLRDSYADCLAPFLLAHYAEVHLIDPRYYKEDVAEYMRGNDISDAVILYSLKNFAEDTSLYMLAREKTAP